jgi:hypothetical protein
MLPVFPTKQGFRTYSVPPGIDQLEKALLKQRFANLAAAQDGYIEKQRKALAD